jgi:hypothetical protein
LRDSALQFAGKIDELEIPDLMTQAVAAARNRDGGPLYRQASLALERMRSLLSSCQGDGGGAFGGLMQCKLRFKVPDACRPTLQQMLGAWKMGGGIGKGRGMGLAGMGLAGTADDGYAMEGYSPLNVPTYGPQRTALPRFASSGAAGTQGAGAGAGAARVADTAHERMGRVGSVEMDRRAVLPEKFPEKYRDALKRYFAGKE